MQYKALFVLSLQILTIFGQDCGFTDTEETSFEMGEQSEFTPVDTLIWQHDIYNVVASSALNTSHFYYLTGLRYQTYYQYLASEIFSQFPDTERVDYLERNVTFTCADGGFRNYYFTLRIKDENTRVPQFNQIQYSIAATVPWPLETAINGPTVIIVSDTDYDIANAEIGITLTNPNFRAVSTRLSPEEPNPVAYYYQVEIYFTRANVAPNTYNLLLFADDGVNSTEGIPLEVIVTPTPAV